MQPLVMPAPDAETEVVDRPWRRAVRHAALVYAISRVALVVITTFARVNEPSPSVQTLGGTFRSWTVEFDSNRFIDIAAHGYPHDAQGAYFPLFPYLIRAVSPLFLGHPGIAAICVANVALFLTLIILYRLADHEFGPDAAGRTLFYLVAFPTGFFLSAVYNVGPLIGLMVAAVYAMRRGHWWWAGAAGLFAATTAPAGVLVLGAFAYEYGRQRGFRPRLDALAVLLVPAGFGAVLLIDRPDYHARSVWGHRLTPPWQPIVDTVKLVAHPGTGKPPLGDVWTHNLIALSTVLLMLTLMTLMFVGPWKIRRDQYVLPLLGFALILVMLSFPADTSPYPLAATSRTGLEVFPGFMMLGRLGADRRVDRTLTVVLLPLQGILLARFLHGGWVA